MVKIKISADGTSIGQNMQLLNISFVILNDSKTAKISRGQHSIGYYSIKIENYDALKICFQNANKEIESMKYILVEEKRVYLDYYVCADWKMMANLLGLKAANSNNPCIWCIKSKDNFWDIKNETSITNIAKGARIIDSLPQKETILTRTIPIHKYIPDMLHLFLRIFDKLFELLITDIQVLDKIINLNAFKTSSFKRLQKLEIFMIENVKSNFHFKIENNKISYNNLSGPNKIKVFKKIKIKNIIHDHPKAGCIHKIWMNFYSIYCKIKKNELTYEEVRLKTLKWLTAFLSCYQRTNVTPYIHVFASHLCDFVKEYGDVNLFTCQGIEKLNNHLTTYFHQGTNKKETTLKQLLEKRNRIELNDFKFCDEIKFNADNDSNDNDIENEMNENYLEIDDENYDSEREETNN